jgi:hypothetical protein
MAFTTLAPTLPPYSRTVSCNAFKTEDEAMFHQSLSKPYLRCSLLFLLSQIGLPAGAQTPAQEQAVVWTANDAQLKWGPCPPFLPAGCGIAVLHGDPVKDNVDVFLRVPGKSTLPLHWHTSAERMILVAGELHVPLDAVPVANRDE